MQNKVRPGAYINFKSEARPVGTIADRGIVTIPLSLNWGIEKTLIPVTADTNIRDTFGYTANAPEMLLIHEAAKKAKTILVYRVNTGEKAKQTDENLTVTAKYSGTRGNALTVKITQDVDAEERFYVATYLDGVLVDEQHADMIENLIENAFVQFSGSGVLKAHAGIVLSGGTNGEAVAQDYLDYLTACEVVSFHTMALPVTDSTLKAESVAFIRRMREDEGKKCQLVLADAFNADYEGVISVKNGVVLSDGTTIDKVQATAYVAGMTAGAQPNQSNTYAAYEDAVDVDTRYTNAQIIAALQAGELLFVPKNNGAVVEQDINTFTTITAEKSKAFSKNRPLRVLDTIAESVQKIFEASYIGKTSNDVTGRDLFKAEVIGLLTDLQGMGAVQNFAADDVTVSAGKDSDHVTVDLKVQPIDSMEKLYMTVTVQ